MGALFQHLWHFIATREGALLVALIALAVSLLAFRESRRSSSAQHAQRFAEYYDSITMYEALRTMRHWVDALIGHDPDQSARVTMRALQDQSGRVIVGGPIDHKNQPAYIDAMRRNVSSYFERLCQFREARHLLHGDFRRLITLSGRQLMYDAVAPLQRAKIAVDVERLAPGDEKARKQMEGWLASFESHLELIGHPTRPRVWKNMLLNWWRRRKSNV